MKAKWWSIARIGSNELELPAAPAGVLKEYDEFLAKIDAQLPLLRWKDCGDRMKFAVPPNGRSVVHALVGQELSEHQKLNLIDAVFALANNYDGEYSLGVRLYPGFVFCQDDQLIGYAPPPFLEEIFFNSTVYGPVVETILIAHPEAVRERNAKKLAGTSAYLAEWLDEKFCRMRVFKLATNEEMCHYRSSLEKELLRLHEL